MNRAEILKSSLRILNRNKLRTFFMILGIIIGIASLSLTFTIGKGFKNQFLERARKYLGPNSIVVVAQKLKVDAKPVPGDLVSTLTLEDMKAIVSEVPNIRMFDPLVTLSSREIIAGNKNISTNIRGSSANGQFVWNRNVTKGEYFNEGDVLNSSRVALIGPKIAETLFGDSDPIGAQIRMGTIPFTVKGVLEPKGVDPHGNDMDQDVIIPITTMMKRVTNVDYINFIKIVLSDENRMDETVTAITTLLDERHHITAGGNRDFSIVTPTFVKEMVNKILRVFNLFLPLISLISLLAAGLVIVILMYMSVNQRVGEIGLRMAVGARRKDISAQFLLESSLTSLIGGITGMIIALISFKVAAVFMHLTFFIPWEIYIFGFFLPVLLGVISGVVPARKAAKLDPVDALR
jgi:putative ABC transport system permease protein